ncbi:porin family protein [Herbaspirillum robiniae]|uniref:Porin family protein n=1 Tax=Herbaspirillum robiniae TaxID=2014887 RepID=A0ABX2LZ54_9BURK|nr:porin family protein [Herbaspirillum robiniae]NUU00864.1 porin family protein [Herbaspirillum robiniae]
MKKNAVFIAAMMAAGSAFAQTADSGVYVGLEGAYVSVNSIATPNGGRKTSETTDVGALRGMIGYQFNKNLGLELGYFATDDFKQNGTNLAGTATYETKIDTKGVDLAVVYKFTEFVPGLFLKAGATHSKVSANITARSGSASASASDSVSGTGYLFGLGYEFAFSQNLGARLGYTRYEKLGGESDNKANMFSAGIKYKF